MVCCPNTIDAINSLLWLTSECTMALLELMLTVFTFGICIVLGYSLHCYLILSILVSYIFAGVQIMKQVWIWTNTKFILKIFENGIKLVQLVLIEIPQGITIRCTPNLVIFLLVSQIDIYLKFCQFDVEFILFILKSVCDILLDFL